MREKKGLGEQREARLDKRREALELSRVSMLDPAGVKRLIAQGLNQEALDHLLRKSWKISSHGPKALTAARLVLEAGANQSGPVELGDGTIMASMLEASLLSRKWGFAIALATNGGDPGKGAGGDTPLTMAAERGAPEEVLTILVDRGFCVSGEDSRRSPLFAAWQANEIETMRALLRLGADPREALQTELSALERTYGGARLSQGGRELLEVAAESNELAKTCAVDPEAGRRGPRAL